MIRHMHRNALASIPSETNDRLVVLSMNEVEPRLQQQKNMNERRIMVGQNGTAIALIINIAKKVTYLQCRMSSAS